MSERLANRVSAIGSILVKNSTVQRVWGAADRERAGSHSRSGGRGARHRDQLGHFAEVLGCSGEEGLVFCFIGTAQPQAVQLQDVLE